MLLDSSDNKEKILTEFLKLCPFDGWSNATLHKAMKRCGLSDNFANLIFENPLLDLADFYITLQNRKAVDLISLIDNFHAKKIRDKIRLALYARFEVEKNHQIALQRLMNFYLDPKNFLSTENGPKPLAQALKTCYKISDSIWKSINDQSTDFNFYTKRLTLAKIILRSLLVFLKDDSIEFQKTKNFIDSEIEKIMKFEKFKAKAKGFSKQAKQAFCAFTLDENGSAKSPKEILKNLPFIRLIKF